MRQRLQALARYLELGPVEAQWAAMIAVGLAIVVVGSAAVGLSIGLLWRLASTIGGM